VVCAIFSVTRAPETPAEQNVAITEGATAKLKTELPGAETPHKPVVATEAAEERLKPE